MLRFFIQFGMTIILLFLSTIVAWYEGSAIIENPWEWNYSTPFSQLLHGEVHRGSDISQLDYFIYAIKYQPTYPVIMTISSLYLLILIGYYFLKERHKWFSSYLFILSGGLFFLSYLICNSPTIGGKILLFVLLVSVFLCIGCAAIIYFQVINRNSPNSKDITN